MKIAGSSHVPLPRERAYALLQDPEVLARSMPGCDGLDKVDDNTYRMKMKILMASFSGLFDGKVHLSDPNPPESFRLSVEGSGRIGFLKGNGLLTLVPAEDGTEVRYEGDVQVGGAIAAVGQRLLDATARKIIKNFFEKLVSEANQDTASASGA